VLAILYLYPILLATAAIGPVPALRDQTFQAHVAGGAEEVGADLAALEGIDKGPSAQQTLKSSLVVVVVAPILCVREIEETALSAIRVLRPAIY
jgi:hypothetical protein